MYVYIHSLCHVADSLIVCLRHEGASCTWLARTWHSNWLLLNHSDHLIVSGNKSDKARQKFIKRFREIFCKRARFFKATENKIPSFGTFILGFIFGIQRMINDFM